MSERLRTEHEQFEKLNDSEFEKLKKQAGEKHEKSAEQAKGQANEIDNLLKKIEKEAVSKSELLVHHRREKDSSHDMDAFSHHQLSTQSFNQTIKGVQKKLPTHLRAFSKFVHNPRVEVASDAVGGTIARPSGLLWGGLFSALASIVVLIICRYYGYEYNFSVGLLSFAGGYCLGLFVELTIRLLRRS